MQGLDLLVKGKTYTVITQFNPTGYTNLVFTEYSVESYAVTLAAFEDNDLGCEIFFDISVPSNIVICN